MPTIVPFSPTNSSPPFQFQATFDGVTYIVQTLWNVSGQRWYVFIFDQSNNLIVTQPLIGSPPLPYNGVNLVGGYFTSTALYYYPALSVFSVTPPIPFNFNPVLTNLPGASVTPTPPPTPGLSDPFSDDFDSSFGSGAH
jgi:hypothetical protein